MNVIYGCMSVESRRMVLMKLFPGQEQSTHIWNGYGGGINWETEVETDVCALPPVKQIANGDLLCRPGSSAWRAVVTWMDGMSLGGGRETVEGGDICIRTADSLPC